LINLAGTKLLARVAMFGFICEIVGAVVVGAYLIFLHRTQPLTVIFDRYGAGGSGSYLPAFAAAILVGAYSCYGFEACGDVAEETADPSRAIPKAMRMTIYIGAGASLFIVLALLLGVPDIRAVISGQESDPIMTILKTSFGPTGAYFVVAVVFVSFLSNVLSIQAAVSRLLYAYARDHMIVGSHLLSRLSAESHIPGPALILSGLVPATIVGLGYFTENTLATIVSFCTAGIYIAFQMVVAAALYARFRGWQPSGAFALGRWGLFTNVTALLYGVFSIINILWPRGAEAHWYNHYSLLITVCGFVGAGAVYMLAGTPYERGQSPAGDAWEAP
jgi:amino acid transporter